MFMKGIDYYITMKRENKRSIGIIKPIKRRIYKSANLKYPKNIFEEK